MPIIIGLLLALGLGGGTAALSNNAVPGDFLFPVDQLAEKIQLTVTKETDKKELKAKFAEERLDEVDELLAKKSKKEDDSKDNDDSATSSDDTLEDDEDSGYGSKKHDKDDANIAEGLSFAIDLLSEIDEGNKYEDLISRLNGFLAELPADGEVQVKLSDSGASFIKVHSEDDGSQKLEVEIKETGAGKVLIKQKTEGKKMEVEMESAGSKVKIKTEDDGRVKIETEVKKEENKNKDLEDDDSDDDSDEDKDDDKDEDEDDDKDDDSKDESDDDSDDDSSGSGN